MINDQYHPHRSVIVGTTIGVRTAPTLVPELKIPVASARSFLGNHSAVTLIAAGKLPASPNPSRSRAKINPATDARIGEADERENRRDGRTEHRRLGVRHRRQAPDDERDGVALLGPQPVDHPAGEEKRERVRELEREDDVGVVDLAPAKFLLQRDL